MIKYAEKVMANRAEFLAKVQAISQRLNINPNWLMEVMNFETAGTFSPSKRNPSSGATGLIQFMPSTAIWLGTTTSALAGMSNVRQLDFVESYYSKLGAANKVKSVSDLYLLTFYPAAVGKPSTYVIASSGTQRYAQNAGLDIDRNGQITVSDIQTRFDTSGQTYPTVPVLMVLLLAVILYVKNH